MLKIVEFGTGIINIDLVGLFRYRGKLKIKNWLRFDNRMDWHVVRNVRQRFRTSNSHMGHIPIRQNIIALVFQSKRAFVIGFIF